MGEMRGAFVELQPADDAMVGEIFGYARFRDAQMISELRLDRFGAARWCRHGKD